MLFVSHPIHDFVSGCTQEMEKHREREIETKRLKSIYDYYAFQLQ